MRRLRVSCSGLTAMDDRDAAPYLRDMHTPASAHASKSAGRARSAPPRTAAARQHSPRLPFDRYGARDEVAHFAGWQRRRPAQPGWVSYPSAVTPMTPAGRDATGGRARRSRPWRSLSVSPRSTESHHRAEAKRIPDVGADAQPNENARPATRPVFFREASAPTPEVAYRLSRCPPCADHQGQRWAGSTEGFARNLETPLRDVQPAEGRDDLGLSAGRKPGR